MKHRVSLLFTVVALALLLAVPAATSAASAAIGWSTVALQEDAPEDAPADDQAAATVVAPAYPLATAAEMAMIDLTNADRVSNGLPCVSFDPALLVVARQRAAAQLTNDPLTHYDASGHLAFVSLLADAGIDYTLAGENLARTSGSDPRTLSRVEQALMNSPTHRKNILEPAFNQLAIGMASDGSGRVAFAEIYRATP